MPMGSLISLPKTKSWEEFENIVRDCAESYYNIDFQIYGRQGQKQNGVDILSKYQNPNTIAIQCKNYLTQRSKKEFCDCIDDEITKIQSLPIVINKYIIATAMNRDVEIQNYVKSLEKKTYELEIWFWEDIEQIISSNENLLYGYYPYLKPKGTKASLFSLSFIGAQLSELINLMLGDRPQTQMYCDYLRIGAVWFNDYTIQKRFLSYVDAIQNYVLGPIPFSEFKGTNEYYWCTVVEQMTGNLLETLNGLERKYYLAGFMLGKICSAGLKDKSVSQEYVNECLKVINQLHISDECKKYVLEKSREICEPIGELRDCFDAASEIYDYIRLRIPD